MAKRKKRAKVQPKKRAKPRRRRAAVRGKARKVSKSARVKATKPTVAGAKPQRAATKKAVQRKDQAGAAASLCHGKQHPLFYAGFSPIYAVERGTSGQE